MASGNSGNVGNSSYTSNTYTQAAALRTGQPQTGQAQQDGSGTAEPREIYEAGGTSGTDEINDINKLKHFSVIYTNDLHGKLTPTQKGEGGLAEVAGEINSIRRDHPNNLLVDGGDISYDPPTSDKLRFGGMPEIMNKMGYDALGAGNHEMQWESKKYGGVEANPNPDLSDNLHDLDAELNFPIVNCNSVLDSTGKRPDYVQPFTIKDLGGVKVGFTSVVTPNAATEAHPEVGEDWTITDPAKSLRETIPQMKEEGADVIIVHGHDNLGRNQKLINNVPGIDLMIGSHDHKTTNEPIMVKDPDGREVPLVEAASHGRGAGEIDMAYDPAKKKTTIVESKIHEVKKDETPPDPEVAALVDKWMKRAKEEGVGKGGK